jgi:type VI protein secretion system component VasA
MGILHKVKRNAIVFNTVAHAMILPPLTMTLVPWASPWYTSEFSIILYKIPEIKFEQLKLTDLPAYLSAQYKSDLFEKLLLGKVKLDD